VPLEEVRLKRSGMECRVRVCREFSGFFKNAFDSGAFGVESGKRHAQDLLSLESNLSCTPYNNQQNTECVVSLRRFYWLRGVKDRFGDKTDLRLSYRIYGCKIDRTKVSVREDP
jgi:hypothetical protein